MNGKILIFLSWLFAVNVFAEEPKDLMAAAIAGNTQRVEALLAQGLDANAAAQGGRTALMGACHSGNLRIVKTLLAYGADTNTADNLGNTALMDAVAFGDETIVKLLITAGADVNAFDKKNVAVLSKAKASPFTNIVKILETAGAKEFSKPEQAPAADATETNGENADKTAENPNEKKPAEKTESKQ